MRKIVLLLYISISCLFLLLQLALFRFLSTSGIYEEDLKKLFINYFLNESILKDNVFLIDERILSNIFLQDTKQPNLLSYKIFRKKSNDSSIKLFTKDKHTKYFNYLINNHTYNSILIIQNEITFGILASQFSLDDNFISFLKENDIKIFNQKSKFFNSNSNITHVIFCTDIFYIHLVVFHIYSSHLLWHGPLTIQEVNTYCDNQYEYDYTDESIYPSFQTKKFQNKINVRIPLNVQDFLKHKVDSKFILCNQTRVKLFKSKYSYIKLNETRVSKKKLAQPFVGENNISNQVMNVNIKVRDAGKSDFRQEVKELLGRVADIFIEGGISFWISSGTCLGWFRQCDAIDYSLDVDIGVRIEDHNPQMIEMLENGGFRLKHLFGQINDSYELSFIYGELKLDIFFFYRDGDFMWNGGTQAKTGLKYKYIFNKFQLCWTNFLDLTIQVPCPTLPYIISNYGTNWFEPVRKWDWKNSPSNVRTNGRWPKNQWKEVIQIYE